MTRAPRILAGEFSAAKIGTLEPLRPMPIPISRRVMKSCSHVCDSAPPMGVRRQKMALMKIVYIVVSESTFSSDTLSGITNSAAAKVVVAGIRHPAADESTVASQSKSTSSEV
jgi:hypothetical protein